MRPPKIICLDIGSKTCGVAKTDALGITVQPVKTIRFDGLHKLSSLFTDLHQVLLDEQPQMIVVGLPLNMDDSAGNQVKKTKDIVQGLQKFLTANGISSDAFKWDYCDERNTSEEALEFMKEQNMSNAEKKANIDTFAAVFILKRYLREHFDFD